MEPLEAPGLPYAESAAAILGVGSDLILCPQERKWMRLREHALRRGLGEQPTHHPLCPGNNPDVFGDADDKRAFSAGCPG